MTNTATINLGTSDIVEIVIGYSKRPPNGDTWQIPIQAIHTALFNIKERFPELLRHLHFSEHPIKPHSLGIESALASAGTTGCVWTDSPRYKNLFITEKMRQGGYREHIENDYPEPEASEQFEALAQAFDQEVAIFESENRAN